MGFSISCPDWEALVPRMERVDPVQIYQDSAAEVGDENEQYFRQAFAETGVGEDFLDDLGTYVHRSGAVYIGIPGTSKYASMARDIEYGTPDIPPSAAVRNTVARDRQRIEAEMSDVLDRRMGEALS